MTTVLSSRMTHVRAPPPPPVTASATVDISWDPDTKKITFAQSGTVTVPSNSAISLPDATLTNQFKNTIVGGLSNLGIKQVTGTRQACTQVCLPFVGCRDVCGPVPILDNGFFLDDDRGTLDKSCQVVDGSLQINSGDDTPATLSVGELSGTGFRLTLPNICDTGGETCSAGLTGTTMSDNTYDSLEAAGFVEGETCRFEYDANDDGTIDTAIEWNVLVVPSEQPSLTPSLSVQPSDMPSSTPSASAQPSNMPSSTPSVSVQPSDMPSSIPSVSAMPSDMPSHMPSDMPSSTPSVSVQPSDMPSSTPSVSAQPSDMPSSTPSSMPSQCVNRKSRKTKSSKAPNSMTKSPNGKGNGKGMTKSPFKCESFPPGRKTKAPKK